MSWFWFWNAFTIVAIIGVSFWGVQGIVRIATRHHENLMRIKGGYPTLNGDTPNKLAGPAVKDAGYIDMTDQEDNHRLN